MVGSFISSVLLQILRKSTFDTANEPSSKYNVERFWSNELPYHTVKYSSLLSSSIQNQ